MLVERYVASIASPEKPVAHSAYKDVGIFIQEFRPTAGLKATFKKSSTKQNGLAVNSTHLFTAQAGKGVIHVHNLKKGNREALIPLQDRISSLCLIGQPQEPGILAMGTESGRVILWELGTGRQVSTPQAHLQAVNCLAIDPTWNFLLTGSADSNVHVWSVPLLLSLNHPQHGSDQIQSAPLRTFSGHRGAITSLTTGHGHMNTNFAVSTSQDKTCQLWDFRTGDVLRTYLLPMVPLCVAVDPVDRSMYTGFEDGSVQLIDFFKTSPFFSAQNGFQGSNMPVQPPASDRWMMPMDAASKVLSLAVVHDSTTLLTGHDDGRILSWNVAKGRYLSKLCDLQAPVTNVLMLSLNEFPDASPAHTLSGVIKPHYESSLAANGVAGGLGAVPEKYAFAALFQAALPVSQKLERDRQVVDVMDDFDEALTHSSLSNSMLQEGIFAFSEIGGRSSSSTETEANLREELDLLKAQLSHSRAAQLAHAERAVDLNGEVLRLREVEEARERAKHVKMAKKAKADEIERKRFMGEKVDSDAEAELARPWDGEAEVSSSADEMSDGG